MSLNGAENGRAALVRAAQRARRKARHRADRSGRKSAGGDEVSRHIRDARRHDPVQSASNARNRSAWIRQRCIRNWRWRSNMRNWFTMGSGTASCARRWMRSWTSRSATSRVKSGSICTRAMSSSRDAVRRSACTARITPRSGKWTFTTKRTPKGLSTCSGCHKKSKRCLRSTAAARVTTVRRTTTRSSATRNVKRTVKRKEPLTPALPPCTGEGSQLRIWKTEIGHGIGEGLFYLAYLFIAHIAHLFAVPLKSFTTCPV